MDNISSLPLETPFLSFFWGAEKGSRVTHGMCLVNLFSLSWLAIPSNSGW